MIANYLPKVNLDYLLGMTDSSGRTRIQPPEVLRGDPDLARRLVDGSAFADRSTTFSFTDPTDWESFGGHETFNELADYIERTLFPGQEQDEVCPVWIRHHPKDGKVEVNLFVPCVYLASDPPKHLKVYYARADKTLLYDACAIFSIKHGLACARSPESARPIVIPKRLPESKSKVYERIGTSVAAKVAAGEIRNRNDVLCFLEDEGFRVTRSGKFISVKDAAGENYRLRGRYFEQSFDLDNPSKTPDPRAQYTTDISFLEQRYEKNLSKRKARFEKRYSRTQYDFWKTQQQPEPQLNPIEHESTHEHTDRAGSLCEELDASARRTRRRAGETLRNAAVEDRRDREAAEGTYQRSAELARLLIAAIARIVTLIRGVGRKGGGPSEISRDAERVPRNQERAREEEHRSDERRDDRRCADRSDGQRPGEERSGPGPER